MCWAAVRGAPGVVVADAGAARRIGSTAIYRRTGSLDAGSFFMAPLAQLLCSLFSLLSAHKLTEHFKALFTEPRKLQNQ